MGEYTYLNLQYDITLYCLHHNIIVISIVNVYVHNYAHYGGMNSKYAKTCSCFLSLEQEMHKQWHDDVHFGCKYHKWFLCYV